MLSFFSSVKAKQCLAKNNSCVAVPIGICYFLAVTLLFFGSYELNKSTTFVSSLCQVKSIGLQYDRHVYFPRWVITVMDVNRIRDDLLIGSSGTNIKMLAWIRAQEYKINQTYPCYRSQYQRPDIEWDWQWNKPTKWKAYGFLFGGMAFFVIATALLDMRRRYHAEFRSTRQRRWQPEAFVRSEEYQHVTPLVETLPPSYDEAVQCPALTMPPRIETRRMSI